MGVFLPCNSQSLDMGQPGIDIYLKPFQSLDLNFQFYIGESGVLPFLLLLPLLMVSGHLHLPSLRFSTPPCPSHLFNPHLYTRSTSLLTAALMLCGVDQAKVALLTRWNHEDGDKEAM